MKAPVSEAGNQDKKYSFTHNVKELEGSTFRNRRSQGERGLHTVFLVNISIPTPTHPYKTH